MTHEVIIDKGLEVSESVISRAHAKLKEHNLQIPAGKTTDASEESKSGSKDANNGSQRMM